MAKAIYPDVFVYRTQDGLYNNVPYVTIDDEMGVNSEFLKHVLSMVWIKNTLIDIMSTTISLQKCIMCNVTVGYGLIVLEKVK